MLYILLLPCVIALSALVGSLIKDDGREYDDQEYKEESDGKILPR